MGCGGSDTVLGGGGGERSRHIESEISGDALEEVRVVHTRMREKILHNGNKQAITKRLFILMNSHNYLNKLTFPTLLDK